MPNVEKSHFAERRLTPEQRDLAAKNLRLAYTCANRRPIPKRSRLDRDDLAQEAALGHCLAVAAHDPSLGKLSTASFRFALQAMRDAQRAERMMRSLSSDYAGDAVEMSLDAPLCDGDSSLGEALGDERPNQEDRLAELEEAARVRALVAKAMARLTERERLIIERRYMDAGFEAPTLEQVSGYLGGLSRERVRQIEVKAVAKLRRALGVHAELLEGRGPTEWPERIAQEERRYRAHKSKALGRYHAEKGTKKRRHRALVQLVLVVDDRKARAAA